MMPAPATGMPGPGSECCLPTSGPGHNFGSEATAGIIFYLNHESSPSRVMSLSEAMTAGRAAVEPGRAGSVPCRDSGLLKVNLSQVQWPGHGPGPSHSGRCRALDSG